MLLTLLVMVVYCTVLILAVGEILFPGEMDIQGFLRVNIGLLGLLVFLEERVSVHLVSAMSRKTLLQLIRE